jgi:hypothetical protein
LASVARKRSRPCLCRNSLMLICINASPPGRGAFWPPSPDVELQELKPVEDNREVPEVLLQDLQDLPFLEAP